MSKTLLETYRMIREGNVLPDLKKPGIGPGSGQESQGNMSVATKPKPSLADVAKETSFNTMSKTADPTAAAVERVKKGVAPTPVATSTPAAPTKVAAPAPAVKPTVTTSAPATTQAAKTAIKANAGSLNAATGGAYDEKKNFTNITQLRNAMYGSNPTPRTVKTGETKKDTGAGGQSPVVGSSAAIAKLPAPKENVGMKGSPLDQTQGAKPSVSQQYRLNAARKDAPSLEKSYNDAQNQENKIKGKAPVGRDPFLDTPNQTSPMARATNPNVTGGGGVGSAFGKNQGSGTTITKPGDAQAATVKKDAAPAKATTPAPAKAQPNNAPTNKKASGTTPKVAPAKKVGVAPIAGKKLTPAQRFVINRRAERDSVGPSGRSRQSIGLGKKTGNVIKQKAGGSVNRRLPSLKEAAHVYASHSNGNQGQLANLNSRQPKGKQRQSMLGGKRYSRTPKPLAEAIRKAIKKAIKTKVNFDPETNSFT